MTKKLTVADLVPKQQVFVARGTRDDEPFECEIELKPLDNAADLFAQYNKLREDNGIYDVIAKLAGITLEEAAYVLLAADNRDELLSAVGLVLGGDGKVDPTTEESSE